ncbi:MAG: hypothetical protein M1818_007792 [Claussenomyces sp. TS43310]|nr:MAG: hypothetical protein M1818_007792 [Claussenomyces sp. TS43310]
MEVFNAYCFGTAGWLATQALPLLVSPRLIITILSPDVHQPSSLEEYFSRSLGIALLTLGILCLLLTGAFPLPSSYETATNESTPPPNPYASPTLILTTLYHSTTSFYTYTRYNRTQQSGFILATAASGTLAAFGLWVAMFGGGSGRISKRTGADKRTSGWPFSNSEARKKRAGKKLM